MTDIEKIKNLMDSLDEISSIDWVKELSSDLSRLSCITDDKKSANIELDETDEKVMLLIHLFGKLHQFSSMTCNPPYIRKPLHNE